MVTRESVNYVSKPPRCSKCKHKRIQRYTNSLGKVAKKMMCSILKIKVRGEGVCDLWTGTNGDVLDL